MKKTSVKKTARRRFFKSGDERKLSFDKFLRDYFFLAHEFDGIHSGFQVRNGDFITRNPAAMNGLSFEIVNHKGLHLPVFQLDFHYIAYGVGADGNIRQVFMIPVREEYNTRSVEAKIGGFGTLERTARSQHRSVAVFG